MRVEGGAWEEVKKTKNTKALVTGLKSKKKFEFKVIATNSVMRSLGNIEESITEASKVFAAAVGTGVSALCSPVIAGGLIGIAIETVTGSRLSKAAAVGVVAATVPLSLLISPVAAPILTVILVKEQMRNCNRGDLTPVSEDEDM